MKSQRATRMVGGLAWVSALSGCGAVVLALRAGSGGGAEFVALLASIAAAVVCSAAAAVLIRRWVHTPWENLERQVAEISRGGWDLEDTRPVRAAEATDPIDILRADLRGLDHAVQALERGDWSDEPAPESDLSRLVETIRGLRDNLRSLRENTRLQAEAADRGDLEPSLNAEGGGGFAEVAGEVNRITDSLRRSLDEATATAQRLAARDFRLGVTGDSGGAFARFQGSMDEAAAILGEDYRSIQDAAGQVSTAALQIKTASRSLAQGSLDQAATLAKVHEGLESLDQIGRENVRTAEEAGVLSHTAHTEFTQGVSRMNKLSEAMQRIKGSADETSKIVQTINDIAFQTNLLALNAAVEAARAGDAGRGFAVVAEEVRSLASRSAEAASNTGQMIEGSIRHVESGVALGRDMLEDLQKIEARVQRVHDMSNAMAVALKKQADKMDELRAEVEQANEVTRRNTAEAEESSAAADLLASQAALLRDLSATFDPEPSAEPRLDASAEADPSSSPAGIVSLPVPPTPRTASSSGTGLPDPNAWRRPPADPAAADGTFGDSDDAAVLKRF